jgi:hypothetical protein
LKNYAVSDEQSAAVSNKKGYLKNINNRSI